MKGSKLTPDNFKAWRLELGLSQRRAAKELGVSHQTVLNYDRGFRHGDKKPVEIPAKIALACDALKNEMRRREAKDGWSPVTEEQIFYIEQYLSSKGVKYKPSRNLTLRREFFRNRIADVIRWLEVNAMHGHSMHTVPGQNESDVGFFVFQFDLEAEAFHFAMKWGGAPSIETGDPNY